MHSHCSSWKIVFLAFLFLQASMGFGEPHFSEFLLLLPSV